MFGKKDGIRYDKVDTILGKDCEFRGTLNSQGVIRIDGKVEGQIIHKGDVIVGETARVSADVVARHVTIAGRVTGNVEAQGRLELVSTGQLRGDIKVGHLVIAEGAVFLGQCSMLSDGETKGHPAAGEPPAES